MSGTIAGGKKAAAKNIAKDPNFYKRIGSKGGSVKGPKGFSLMDIDKHHAASVKGGSSSKRRPIPTPTDDELTNNFTQAII